MGGEVIELGVVCSVLGHDSSNFEEKESSPVVPFSRVGTCWISLVFVRNLTISGLIISSCLDRVGLRQVWNCTKRLPNGIQLMAVERHFLYAYNSVRYEQCSKVK